MPRDQTPASVTADDVAAIAGVSRWTVNRAFKPNASISEKTRQKVLKAAEHLDYFPDLLASSLASDRSNLVSLLIDDFSNPHKLVMLEHLTGILRKNGWETLLVNTRSEDDTNHALLSASQRRVDAAVLIGSRFDDVGLATALGARRVRKLIVFARSSVNRDTISICCDDKAAMNTIVDHVITKGYRRPLFLAGPQTQSAHLLRKETFVKRWHDAKGVEPEVTSVSVYDPQLAYRHITGHLAKYEPGARPDILICENDALAMGAIDAIRYVFGLRVPEDIAVTGFDDVPQSSNPRYRLTTYRQPISAMAAGLVQVLHGETELTMLSRFSGELVVRESA